MPIAAARQPRMNSRFNQHVIWRVYRILATLVLSLYWSSGSTTNQSSDDHLLDEHSVVYLGNTGTPRDVTYFRDIKAGKVYLAPTDLLLVPVKSGNSQFLGNVSSDPETPETVTLTFEAKFAIDPWVDKVVSEDIERNGGEYGGMFQDWELSATSINFDKNVELEVNITGNAGRLEFTVHENLVGKLLVQLAGSIGIQIEFDWVYSNEPSVTGTWRAPPFSFARRDTSQTLSFSKSRFYVKNVSPTSVYVDYLDYGDGNFYWLNPSWAIPPNKSVRIRAPRLKAKDISIPVAAIRYKKDGLYSLADDFLIARTNTENGVIHITNLLTHDEELGTLNYVEISVEFLIGDSRKVWRDGPHELTPYNTKLSKVDINVVGLGQNKVRGRITGKAFYTEGHVQDFTTMFNENNVYIDNSVLRE